MRIKFSVILIASILILGCAQPPSSTINQDWKLYRQAISVADMVTAAGALNSILVKDSTQLNAYDSLALVYLKLGMDRSAAIIARQGLEKNENRTLLEVSASSLKNLGNFESSLNDYLRLLELEPNDIGFLYEAAFGYIQLNAHKKAATYVEQVIAHPESSTTIMTEFVNNTGQNLPYKAVAFNMRGFIQMQSGNDTAAIQSYQEAIQIVPDYQLALNNLKVLTAKLETGR